MAVSAKPSRRSLWARLRLFWLEILIFSLLCLPLLLVGLAASDAGTRWLLQAGERLSGGAVQFKVVSGSLLGHLKINEVQLHSQAAQLRIAGLALDWQAQRLFAGELAIDRLYLGHIDLHMPDSQTPPSKPASLRLPLAVALSDVRVDGLSLNGRKLLDQLAFTVSSDGDYHRLQGLTLATPWFSGRGELRLDGRAPFQLGGSVNLQASHAEASWQMAALLGNRLDDLSLTGQGSGAPAGMAPFRLGFDLRLDPFAASPYGLVKSGRFDSHAVDLHSFAASLPHSALDIELRAQPQGEQVAAQLALVNRLPGSWPDQRLPLAQLDARLRLSSHTAQIDALTASKGGARISVSGQLSRQAMALSAKLADVPLADYGGPALPLSGELRMTGAPSLPQLQGRLRSAKLLADIDGGLQVQGGQHWLLAKTLRLAAAGGELALNGRLALGSGRAFSLEGQYQHFDPASLAGLLGYPLASGELNGRMTLSGALQPAARASVVLALRDSRFNGQTLSGDASGTLVQGRLSAVAMNLALGSNRLKASGDFGKPGDSLALDFALPSIADLGNGFAGRLEARLRLSGTLHRPSIDGSARADQLRLPGGVAVNHAQLQAKIDAVAAQALDAPFALKLDVQGMAASRLQLASAHIDLQGQRAAHRGTLSGQGSVAGRGFDFAATANGALDEHGWRGWIERLENSGDLPLRMQGPARVQLGLGHASIDEMQLLALGSQLRINHADWQGARFAVVGDIRDVALADWLARFPELAPRVNTDLVLGGRFDLHGDQGLGGSLTLERQRGDISLLVDDPLVKPMPLRLSAAKAALELAGDTAALSLDLQSASFGYARGRFASRFVRGATGWQPAPGAALQGSLHAEMPALDWVGPLLGPTAAVSGRLSADLTADGALGKPSWYGRLKLDDFGLRLPELGTQWHDGKLEAVLQGETAQLTALSLQGGRGEASASGRLSLREAGPEGALTVRFRQFGALTRPDRNLTVSGETTLSVEGQTLGLTGRLRADEGLFELQGRRASALGDDVLVVGRSERSRSANKPPPMNLRFDLDLGDRFQFKSQGVEARLSGLLRVAASPNQRLGASGALKVEEGRYLAYGQNLSINHGIVSFQGPIDNPALDLLAERKNLPVAVGVKMGGTLLAPQISLFSDQAMPDSEKLSWLVLGHGSTATTARGDADVLLAAGEALFSAGQSVSLRQQLAGSLGLDDISVGRSTAYTSSNDTGNVGTGSLPGSTTGVANSASNPALASRVVTLGKRLSDRAYVSYEQSLDSVGYAVKLSYQLSRRISLALTAGQTSAVDILYSWLF